MAAPTEPFNQLIDGINQDIVAPMGLSRLTVPSGGSLTVTFQATPAYIRVATAGDQLQLAWTAAGEAADGKNSVGGAWPNPWAMPGQISQLVITDAVSGGTVDCDLAVMASPIPAERFPAEADLVGFEGATEAHANT